MRISLLLKASPNDIQILTLKNRMYMDVGFPMAYISVSSRAAINLEVAGRAGIIPKSS